MPSRRYDARPRDEYDSDPRGRSRGGRRDDFRDHGGFSSRRGGDYDYEYAASPSRVPGARGRGGRGGRGGARGGRGRGDRGSRGRGDRASFRDYFGEKNDAAVTEKGTFRNADPSKRNDTGQNDWDCGVCGADNFARRIACFRCGAERGAAGVGLESGPVRVTKRDANRSVDRRDRDRDRDRDPRRDRLSERRDPRENRWDVSRESFSGVVQTDANARDPIRAGCSRFYATWHPGLEEVVAAELRAFPIEALDVRPGASGVYFVGTKKTGVLANVWLRSAVRVLVELRHGWLDSTAPGGAAVYDFVRYAAPWPEVVPEATRATFSFESRVRSCSDVTSTKLAATRAKDAVCDALVDANGWRPPPPARRPRLGGRASVPVAVQRRGDAVQRHVRRESAPAGIPRRGNSPRRAQRERGGGRVGARGMDRSMRQGSKRRVFLVFFPGLFSGYSLRVTRLGGPDVRLGDASRGSRAHRRDGGARFGSRRRRGAAKRTYRRCRYRVRGRRPRVVRALSRHVVRVRAVARSRPRVAR